MDTGDIEADRGLRLPRDKLIEVLAMLGSGDKFGASGHVIAAIEFLEAMMTPGSRSSSGMSDAGPIAVLARRMTEDFGARAESVARRQLDEATGSTFLVWAAIISRIRE